MKRPLNDVLIFRLASDVRADLDAAARATGLSLSACARRALSAGLVSICSRTAPASDDPRPPSAPTASMRTAA